MSALVRRKAFSAGRSEAPPFSSTKSTLAEAISPRGLPGPQTDFRHLRRDLRGDPRKHPPHPFSKGRRCGEVALVFLHFITSFSSLPSYLISPSAFLEPETGQAQKGRPRISPRAA